jgi:hypothetical protein
MLREARGRVAGHDRKGRAWRDSGLARDSRSGQVAAANGDAIVDDCMTVRSVISSTWSVVFGSILRTTWPAADSRLSLRLTLSSGIDRCIYLPNGNPQPGPQFTYKLAWFDRLIRHTAERKLKSHR